MVAAQQEDYLYRDRDIYPYRPTTPNPIAARRAMLLEVDDLDDVVDPMLKFADRDRITDRIDPYDIDPYWAQQLREPLQTIPQQPMQPGVQPGVQQPTMPTLQEIDGELSSALQYKNQLANLRTKINSGVTDATQLGLPQGMKVPTINEIQQEEARVNEYISMLNQMKNQVQQVRLQYPGVVQHRQPFQQQPGIPQRLSYPGARTRVQTPWTRDITDVDVLDRRSMMEPTETQFQTNVPAQWGGWGWRRRWGWGGWGWPGFGFGGFGWPGFGFGFGFPGFGFGFGFPWWGFHRHHWGGWW